jgi:hypothetical protein
MKKKREVVNVWGETEQAGTINDSSRLGTVSGSDLLPCDALAHVANLYSVGAQKYSARGWEAGIDMLFSLNAILRHTLKLILGEKIDQESRCHHAAAIVFNALAILTFWIRKTPVKPFKIKCPEMLAMISITSHEIVTTESGGCKEIGKPDIVAMIVEGIVHDQSRWKVGRKIK